MNPPKRDVLDYIHFPIAAQRIFTCTEAARCQPERGPGPGPRCLSPPAAKTAARHGGVVAGSKGICKPQEGTSDPG
mgnify:CR=1 FL=1